jgi:hypothetical protein
MHGLSAHAFSAGVKSLYSICTVANKTISSKYNYPNQETMARLRIRNSLRDKARVHSIVYERLVKPDQPKGPRMVNIQVRKYLSVASPRLRKHQSFQGMAIDVKG